MGGKHPGSPLIVPVTFNRALTVFCVAVSGSQKSAQRRKEVSPKGIRSAT